MRLIGLCLSVLLLAACDRAAPPSAETAPAPSQQAAVAVSEAASPAPAGFEAPAAQVAPPAAGAALAAIYGEAGDGSAEYTLADGRTATFWAGYAYRVDGRERYTAFAYTAPPSESGFAPPGQQVTLAQLTYTLDNGRWIPGAVQNDVGVFGGAGRGPEFDAERRPETYAVSAERTLLALPSSYFAYGTALFAYDVFVYVAADDRWRFLGHLDSGSDATASCLQEPSSPADACVRNTGTLRFAAAPVGVMPDIEIVLVGTVSGNDGGIRPAGAGDMLRYVYDEPTGTYVVSSTP